MLLVSCEVQNSIVCSPVVLLKIDHTCLFNLSSVAVSFLNLTLRVGGAAYLKVNKSVPLSLNHHIFSNTEPIYTK